MLPSAEKGPNYFPCKIQQQAKATCLNAVQLKETWHAASDLADLAIGHLNRQ